MLVNKNNVIPDALQHAVMHCWSGTRVSSMIPM